MYLLKRDNYYYFRIKLPSNISHYFNSNEIKKSLRTTKLKIAKSLASVLYNDLQKFIWMVQYKMISDSTIDKIAQHFKSFHKERLVKELKSLVSPKHWIVEELDMYDDIISDYKMIEHSDEHNIVDADIQKLKRIYPEVNIKDEIEDKLAKKLATVHIDILKATKQEFKDGIYDNSYIEPVINDTLPDTTTKLEPEEINTTIHPLHSLPTISSQVAKISKDFKINNAFEQWLQHKEIVEKRSKSSIKDYRAAYRYLKLFFNIDDNIHSVSTKDFKNMQKTMIMFPKNVLTASKYKNKNLIEIIQIINDDIANNTRDKIALLTAKRINGILTHLHTFYDYLEYEEYIKINPVNVKALIEEDSTKTAYLDDDLEMIFSDSTILYPYAKDISLVALYSGMRIGEIIALEKNNIIDRDGILFYDIIEGKTENAPRIIPVHTKVIPTIQRLLKQKGTFLFNDGRYNASQKQVNSQLSKIIVDKDKTFHSFRKNFTSQLYDNFIELEPYIKVLLGHSTKSNLSYNIYAENKLNDPTRIKIIESLNFKGT